LSAWPSAKAGKVLSALLRIGWRVKRQAATSHKVLERPGWPDYVFAFHDGRTLPPEAVARLAKRTGLRPEDL
jgi:predicted RNA binding protein YcfA (HicA-like mRNA interferase family)